MRELALYVSGSEIPILHEYVSKSTLSNTYNPENMAQNVPAATPLFRYATLHRRVIGA
jgi:hypothetical protein